MESVSPPSLEQVKCCDCGCSCSTMNWSLSRSVKRKYEEFVEEKPFTIPGFIIPQNARVEIKNECQALRETVISQQQTIQELVSDLEEERNASSSAANEAMSMILRLQGEKAEIQMELRQFKRFAEEKMAHDQEENLSLDDLLYEREEVIQSLTYEMEAYKHRMMSYGLTEAEADGVDEDKGMNENSEDPFEFPHYEIYPPLKINVNESRVYMDGDDDEAGIGETQSSRFRLKDLEYRIEQLEKSPSAIQSDLRESVGNSPMKDASFKKTDLSHLDNVNDASNVGDDEDDRVYTIDSIHERASTNGAMDPKASVAFGGEVCKTTPQDSDLEIQKLYARLHTLEADRESMRQSIISIGTDKAQLVLLKEIAQNLCKDMSPMREMPVKKQSVVKSFSFVSLFKWVLSFFSRRRKARRCKYAFGLSPYNAGLLMLLDQGPRVGKWRCINSENMWIRTSGPH